MSKATKQFFTAVKEGEGPGVAGAAKQTGSFLREAGGAIWDGAKPLFDYGRAEAAAAIFSGTGYVMYMKGDHGIDAEADRTNELADKEREIGGREM